MTGATLLYASLLTFLYLYLSIEVIRRRRLYREPYGISSDHPDLMRAIRAHANFSEYTPLFLILMFLLEMRFRMHLTCFAFGLIFLVGRLSHAYAFLIYESRALAANANLGEFIRFRLIGMVCTLGSLASLALILLFQYLFYA